MAACACLLLAGCGAEDDGNFSQHPGFAEWYAANPPSEALPSAAERALLARYRPRVFVPAGHEGPIAFYEDYVAHGRLYDGDGRLVSEAVKPGLLNRHEDDPGAVFEHEPGGAAPAPTPVAYGRVDREAVDLPGCPDPVPFTFLTYNLVFRNSGLPAGVPGWQRALLAALAGGDPDDWHQLDHYTAVTMALAPAATGEDGGGGLRPVAVTFQQHNYLRTYLVGGGGGPGRLLWPEDGRVAVDVAIGSNELYPHREGRVRRRAVSFLRPDSARYLVTGEDKPLMAADDVTDPAREVDYQLRLLPPADAFYVFQGWLGERRLLPGRDGPPGADYNTLPAFKPRAAQMLLFTWHEGDEAYPERIEALFAGGRPAAVDLAPAAAAFAQELGAEAICARQGGRGGATDARADPG